MILRFYPNVFLIFLFFTGCLCGHVQAQSLPGPADPGRFDERFGNILNQEPDTQIIPPHGTNIPSVIPEATDGFTLRSVSLKGNRLFSQEDLQPIINKYIGRSVDFKTLSHLAARITAQYREAGYFLSVVIIPKQEVKNANVVLRVIEGFVHDVVIHDPLNLLIADTLDITQKTIAKIKKLQPLHGPSLERYMLLLNEGLSVTVKSIIDTAPDIQQDGGVLVTLNVTENEDVFVSGYNNFGSRFVGPHQFNFLYSHGGLLSTYDTFTIRSTSTFPIGEAQYGSLSYTSPLNAEGLRFNTSVSYTNSEPGSTLRALEVESDSFSFDAGLTYPLIRSRRNNLNIGAALEIRNTATEFLDEELIDDKTRSLIFDIDYNLKHDDGSLTNMYASLHKGFDILESKKTGSDNLSRAQGRSDFIKITAAATRIQKIPQSNFNVLTQIEGQYTPHPLLSSAEFGYGGETLGRAYDSSEITGDKGLSAGVELRYNGLAPLKKSVSLTPFAFHDIGKIWNNDRNSKPISAASAGFGTYYQIGESIYGSLTVAYPLTKSVATPVMGGERGPRVLFEAKFGF